MAKKVFLFISLCFAAVSANIDEERLDSLAEYASSAVIGKDDSPVSLSGDFMVRMRNHSYYEFAPFQIYDKHRTYFESGLSLALGVNPSSFVSFWGNLLLPMDFSGYYTNSLACSPNTISNTAIASENASYACKMPYHHSADFYSASMQENITVGIDLRGGEFGAELKAGGVLWTNASPLTVWERQFTPQYVSQFETYEWERTVSLYYKEKSFSPVTEGGRAFWSNRSFGGLALDIYKMPFGLLGQVLFSQTQDDDQGTRDGLRGMSNQLGEVEGLGTLDFRSDVIMARLAKKDVGNMMLGLNFLNTFNDRDIIYENPGIFFNVMGETKGSDPRLIDYSVGSFDIRGNINPNFYIHLDIAVSVDDSIKFKRVQQVSGGYEQDAVDTKRSDASFAVYLKAQTKYGIPITSEFAYIAPDFYSPYGMTDYSRNRTWRKDQIPLGAGAYRYSPNLAGANFKLEPQFNRGRFNVMYSQHRQIEKGMDVVAFPYRLNGRAMWEATTQWSKYNPGVGLLIDNDNGSKYDYYQYRAGGGRNTSANMIGNKYNQVSLSGGTWEVWEYFGNYSSAQDAADMNLTENAKWSSVISIDMGYDIGHWFGTDRNIMLSANTALSGISTSIAPLPYSEKATDILWGWYFQAEPAIAITPNLHGLLIAGVELFRAPNTYGFSLVQNGSDALPGPSIRIYEFMPINYRDLALGAGFDWDFAPRAGLHVRYKWSTHDDETNAINNWKGHFVSAETKVWF
ncbi:MAG: hypothetical protein LBH25_03880 [Fibromonadaceae bacterium]|nr:hypothetical protein [Fibromonadaceae bacterium]